MGDAWSMCYVAENPLPLLSYGEIMDRLFDMWCQSGDARTFDEFITPANEQSLTD